MTTDDNNNEMLTVYEGSLRPDIEKTHILMDVLRDEGDIEYQVALREWVRNNYSEKRPRKKDFLYTKMWVPKKHLRTYAYTLKENETGDMLLRVQDGGQEMYLVTNDPEKMSMYLLAARERRSLDDLRDMAEWGDEVAEEERSKYLHEWLYCSILAQDIGEHRELAGAAGLKTLRIAALYEKPMAELERCTTAKEVRELVEEYEHLVCPIPYTAAPHNSYERHKCAWQICLLMRKLAKPQNFSEMQALVSDWEAVCQTLVGAEYMGLEALKWTEDCSEGCAFEEADFVEFSCSRVSLSGFKPLNLAERLAHLLEGKLMDLSESDQDGDSEWFKFKKREK